MMYDNMTMRDAMHFMAPRALLAIVADCAPVLADAKAQAIIAAAIVELEAEIGTEGIRQELWKHFGISLDRLIASSGVSSAMLRMAATPVA